MSTQRIPAVASLLSLVLPAWLSATVATRKPSATDKMAPKRVAEATLQVTNENSQAINVIVRTQDGQQYILGEVGRQKTQVFDLPSDVVGTANVRILADPLDHFTGFESEPITLAAGQGAALVVEDVVTNSQLTIN
jgi:hypothetical protein